MHPRGAGEPGSTREPRQRRLRKRFLFQAEYNAPIHLSLLEAAKHVIDGLQRQGLNRGPHFAVPGKRERLFQVQASAYDGATNRVAV